MPAGYDKKNITLAEFSLYINVIQMLKYYQIGFLKRGPNMCCL